MRTSHEETGALLTFTRVDKDAYSKLTGQSTSDTKIQSLVVKIVERCNINCTYCYMYNHVDKSYASKPPLMRDDIFDAMLDRAAAYLERRPGQRMGLTFHGGEPTLAGPKRLRRFARRARQVLGDRLSDLAVQTNGTLIDDALMEVFAEERISVGVSLDGPPAIHDRVRIDHFGAPTHARSVAGLRRLQAAGLDPGVLCVVDPGVDGLAVYSHFLDLGISSIDFLLPDATHDTRARLYPSDSATPIADYLIPIFRDWFARDDPGIRIRLFRTLLGLILGKHGFSDAYGNPVMGYLVIDTDGAIQALDALKTCEPGIADSGLNVLVHGFDDLARGLPLVNRLLREGAPLPDFCRTCDEAKTCGGGYLPHRYSSASGFNNPSIWCEDIRQLLAVMRQSIVAVAGEQVEKPAPLQAQTAT